MKKTLSLLALAACLSASNASALTITVNDNLADNAYLAAGSTLNGSFNLASTLPSGGNFVLTSALATFLFQDNADLLSQQTITGEWENQDNGNGNQVRNIDTWTSNPAEGVSLSIGVAAITGQTTYSESLQDKDSSFYFVGDGKNKVKYTTIERSGEKGYSGEFELSQTLDIALLLDLSNIAFSLTGTEGDLIYKSGTLTAEFEPAATAAADQTPVPTPEPSTMALLGLGLAGMGIAARRRKKN
ncbi:PEP-CTERM sorting domain-containing protein [Geobacter sp.]|uniref:PEP-CTERM sorting domain-containing protein n=1 Tax=Geobacter sp. TaxID=46610 RepID=UPI0027BA59E6|nr:PEP-CTERM sorting domain-containing protein [Geobacter sp.]